MLSTDAVAPIAASVVVDLIGDLDATLGTVLAETLVDLTANGTQSVLLTTKHVATVTSEGIAALAAALRAARASGLAIALTAGNRKLRNAFADADILFSIESPTPLERARHYMFAHHDLPKRARAGALPQPA